jgi:hypothetical protein
MIEWIKNNDRTYLKKVSGPDFKPKAWRQQLDSLVMDDVSSINVNNIKEFTFMFTPTTPHNNLLNSGFPESIFISSVNRM